MNALIVTVDLDWACEAAVAETLEFLLNHKIYPTVFITHRSFSVESLMDQLEVGLHPYFHPNSSHGATIDEVVKHVMSLPHNLPAFRCHRFASCNTSMQAMKEAGMLISSNVCTDLETVAPFKNRFGLLEVPVFLEDGGYLWQNYPLSMSQRLKELILGEGIKVIILHPMHFVINTPNFEYMLKIKQIPREEWQNLTKSDLNHLRWKGRGIRDLMLALIQEAPQRTSLGKLIAPP
jgi:hypothetical protein